MRLAPTFVILLAGLSAPAFAQARDAAPLVTIMNKYVKAYSLYPLMMLVDPHGRPVAVNTVDAAGNTINTGFIYNENFSSAKWFKDALEGRFLEGRNGYTGTAVQPPARHETVAKTGSTDGYSIAFSAPVRNNEGKLVGIWVNFADMALVDSIVGHFRQEITDKGGWDSISMIVTDSSGLVLVDYEPGNVDANGQVRHDFANILQKNFLSLGLKAAAAAAQGGNGSTEEYNPDSKTEQVFGYSHAGGAYNYSGLGWNILIGLNEADAYRGVHAIATEMTMAGLLIFGLAIILGLIIGGVAARPLRRSTGIMLRLAEGDLNVAVPKPEGRDELNDITRALQIFKDKSQHMEQMKADQIAKDKASAAKHHQGMVDMANNFEASVGQIIGTVASAATELQANAESLAMIADETTKQSTAVAAATEEASVSVQTVASSTEELSSSINEISRQVSESTRVTSEAVREVKNTDQTVVSLADAASQIGGVVKLIQDIAEQTNLLALNATIEAARAGEAGKGFAVVASEVKSLANQTAKATEEISSKITAMQGVANTAVTAIRGIGATIEQISHIIGSIASAVEEQSAATKEIANNVSQASAGTSEVAGSIANVNQAASESHGASNDVLQAAKELSIQSEKLKKEMGLFLDNIRRQ